jgi:hypothetical protein
VRACSRLCVCVIYNQGQPVCVCVCVEVGAGVGVSVWGAHAPQLLDRPLATPQSSDNDGTNFASSS